MTILSKIGKADTGRAGSKKMCRYLCSKPFPILVVVDTKGITGRRNEAVIIQYEHKRQAFIAIGEILFDVMPASNQEPR